MATHRPTIGISSWSVHRAIGLSWWDSPATPPKREETWGAGTLPILDFPAAATKHGIDQVHLCHFHVERRDDAWLGEFRAALADAGIRLSMLLIDDGDITHPSEHERDLAWVGGWVDTAAKLGAEAARVVAGKQKPSPETLRRSADGLKVLAARGKSEGVRIATENWLDLTAGPHEVDYLMDAVGDDLEFLADFGNWKGASKYADLEHILARAGDTHAKAHFSADGTMDSDDFRKCLLACDATGYNGPFTLIYESEHPDEWAAIETERQFVLDHFGAAQRTA